MRYLTSAPGIICLLTILFLVPFIDKAFHIDDPLFIWAAQQIQEKPLDPFGFPVNWNDKPQDMWFVTKNPPLTCYYIAAAAVAGYDEVLLHVAFLLPACMVTVGTYFLAKRFVQRPLWPAFLTLITPAFWVSATNVMSDVWMTAFCVWAVILWFKARDTGKWLHYAACGVLIALAALSKYYGVVLLVPLCLNLVLRRTRGWGWILTVFIPLAALIGFELWTQQLYGQGLEGRGMVREAMAWSAKWGAFMQPDRPFNAVVAIVYLGGCALPILFLAHWMFSRRSLAVCAALALGVMVLGQFFSWKDAGQMMNVVWALPVVWTHGIFFAFAAVCGLAATLGAARQSLVLRQSPDVWVLIAWVGLTCIFVSFFNWTVNARIMLPMIPQLAILCQLAIERKAGNPAALSRQKYTLSLVPAALLALIVVHADYQYAGANRTVAHTLYDRQRAPLSNTVFGSHWGFQYYMQQMGARPINSKHLVFSPGQAIVMPDRGTYGFKIPLPLEQTMNTELNIPRYSLATTFGENEGFYNSLNRTLPYSYRIVKTEGFLIRWVK